MKTQRTCVGYNSSSLEKVKTMSKQSFSFIVYMIHACADQWGKTPSEVYCKLKDSGCIDQYLVPHFEILHTQGSRYLVEDIREYLELRGVAI